MNPLSSARWTGLLTSLMLLLCPLCLPAQNEAGLHAGTALVDITPQEWPLYLRGSFVPKPTESANDPLHARILALQNGEGRAVVVIVDNLGVSREILDPIKAAAAEATGWKASEILIAATHTHSAPNPGGSRSPQEEAYAKLFFDGLVGGITEAVENLQPASVAWGAGELREEVFNRRWYLEEGTMPENPFGELDKVKMNPNRSHIVEPAGPVDPKIAFLDVRTRRNQPLGFLANYALHYVGRIPGSQVSADYFGEFSRLMAYRLGRSNPPEDLVVMLSNGASGDINNIDFTGTRAPRAPFEQVQVVATKAADEAWRATQGLTYESDAPVGIVEREVEISRRQPTAAEIQRAEEIVAMTKEEQEALPWLAPIYAGRTLSLAEKPETDQILIQALRVGDQAIVTLPYEVLVEIGLELQEKSPFPHTFMIGIANGYGGYLPPPHQHDLGGYETWLGTNRVEKNASVILTDHLLEMLAELQES